MLLLGPFGGVRAKTCSQHVWHAVTVSSTPVQIMFLRNLALLKVSLICLPTAALVILACAGAWRLSVFRLDIETASYRIGAQGYTLADSPPRCVVIVRACPDESSDQGFAYAAPADWPDEIKDLSLWLLLHFILARTRAKGCRTMKPQREHRLVCWRWPSQQPAAKLQSP